MPGIAAPRAKSVLPGALAAIAGYRGTSCEVRLGDYLVHRINEKKSETQERGIAARRDLEIALLALVKDLSDQDFETLVELIFANSGWRRVSSVGGVQKTKDIELLQPMTNENACVQIKTRTTTPELKSYLSKLNEDYSRLFFVYHTGNIVHASEDPRLVVLGPEQIAKLSVDAGVIRWIIDKSVGK